jgi:hypothetical protein
MDPFVVAIGVGAVIVGGVLALADIFAEWGEKMGIVWRHH